MPKQYLTIETALTVEPLAKEAPNTLKMVYGTSPGKSPQLV
jgi:hypothetical protein